MQTILDLTGLDLLELCMYAAVAVPLAGLAVMLMAQIARRN